jgi:hypothetical protein
MDTFIDGNGAKCRSKNFISHPYKCFAIMVIILITVRIPAIQRKGLPHLMRSDIQTFKYGCSCCGSGLFKCISTKISSSIGPQILARNIIPPKWASSAARIILNVPLFIFRRHWPPLHTLFLLFDVLLMAATVPMVFVGRVSIFLSVVPRACSLFWASGLMAYMVRHQDCDCHRFVLPFESSLPNRLYPVKYFLQIKLYDRGIKKALK